MSLKSVTDRIATSGVGRNGPEIRCFSLWKQNCLQSEGVFSEQTDEPMEREKMNY